MFRGSGAVRGDVACLGPMRFRLEDHVYVWPARFGTLENMSANASLAIHPKPKMEA